MPYNIKPITDPFMLKARANAKTEAPGAEMRREHEKRLSGYIKDFDHQTYEDVFTSIQSCLAVFLDGAVKIIHEEDSQGSYEIADTYYYAMQNILNQIDVLNRMIDGYDEYVSNQQAQVKGLNDWLPAEAADALNRFCEEQKAEQTQKPEATREA